MFWEKFNIHVLNPLVLSFIAVLCIAVYCFMYFNNILIAGFIAILGVPFLIRWINFFRVYLYSFHVLCKMLDTITFNRKIINEWYESINKNTEKVEKEKEEIDTSIQKLTEYKQLVALNVVNMSNTQMATKILREEIEKYRGAFLYKKIFNVYDPAIFDDVVKQSVDDITLKLADIDKKITENLDKLEREHGQKS